MNFNKTGKVFSRKFVGTGPSSYKKKNLLGRGLIKVENHCLCLTLAEVGAGVRRQGLALSIGLN
jgi:hypothetical protein